MGHPEMVKEIRPGYKEFEIGTEYQDGFKLEYRNFIYESGYRGSDVILRSYAGDASRIYIPDGVTIIEGYVFKDDKKITHVEIPPSVESIAMSAFHNCTNLESVQFNWNKNGWNPNKWDGEKPILENWREGCYTIGISAFESCTSLTSLELPPSIRNIEKNAFHGCSHLHSICGPKTILSNLRIESGAFSDCKELQSVQIRAKSPQIAEDAFSDCPLLNKIDIDENSRQQSNSVNTATSHNSENVCENTNNDPVQQLMSLAEQGDCDAIYALASNYYTGKNGFEEDDNKAFYWTKKAVEADPHWSGAWDLLGRCYSFGVGTDKNTSNAVAAYKKAVECGDQSCVYRIAEELYASENEDDRRECLVWLEKSCTIESIRNDGEALLGFILVRKELGTNDPQRGEMLLSKWADQGDAECARHLADAYWQDKILKYDAEKIAHYYTIALDNGAQDSWRVYYFGGLAHYKGICGASQDYKKARSALEKLVPFWENNEFIRNYVIRANAILGCMCCEGIGGSTDGVLGEKCLLAAIKSSPLTEDDEKDIENSLLNLGRYYYSGQGVLCNRDRAAYYYRKAADRGNQSAIHNLNVMNQSYRPSSNTVNTSKSDYSTEEPTRTRHPIRGAILGYFIGGIIAMFVGNFSPVLGWLILIAGVLIGIWKG